MQNLAIIGGGAAGIMAAISAKRQNPDLNVQIFEALEEIGKKILVSGAGRCNLTNSSIESKNFHGATQKFIGTVINQFKKDEIIHFFKDIGVEMYEEFKEGKKSGKIYPITNESRTVVELLLSELNKLGVELFLSTKIKDVKQNDNTFELISEEKSYKAEFIVIATGGISYPQIGANDFGYRLASSYKHNIIEPVPVAVPLETNHWIVKRLAGIRTEAKVTSYIREKKPQTSQDEILFTRYGLSGPAILQISREISIRINREKGSACIVTIDLLPMYSRDELYNKLIRRWSRRPNQDVLFSLYGLVKNKIAKVLLKYLKINEKKKNKDLSKKEEKLIVDTLSYLEMKIISTKSWDQAEFTAGGINTHEISEYTLESKKIRGLYFVGEVLNVDGDIGGYNLSWAWSSGWVAGKNIAKVSKTLN
ncbi:aminoacetone oxidase family FAD-binding enzyme [Candidatus Dojkabacteria bacterium]|nr:aminoacetone oxidase family FAD-binding enzyme [Candidatus Dojkabacteria bacterium]